MTRYILSDTHIGHRNIHKFRDNFTLPAAEDHWEAAMEGLRKIPKRATLFLLGGIAFTEDYLDQISKLKCQNKILVCGNHDLERGITMKRLVDVYDQVYSLRSYKKHWLSHCPIHPMELRGKRCVHGHIHPHLILDEEGKPDPRYINVCVEYTGYDPIPWEYAVSDEYQQECIIKWNNMKKLRGE